MRDSSFELRWSRGLSTKQAGDRGEDLALSYLLQRGYSLVERNYRTREGEIDLILRHGEALVFVEVKLRRGIEYGHPLEAVTRHKQKTILALAERYIAESEPAEVRFDVVGITISQGEVRIEHIQDAFQDT